MSITDTINNNRASTTKSSDVNTLIQRWITYKAPADSSALYSYLGPTIDSAISSYAGGQKQFRVPAYKIAFEALKSYDPTKGVDARTHVYNNLKRLNRIYADRTNIVHIPEGVSRDYSIITKAISSFNDEHGREPNDDELADLTKLSKKRIDKVLGRSTSISGSEAVTEEGADRVSSKNISENTYIDYLYASSDNIDKKIIEMTSGYNGKKVMKSNEVARRLNMTPAAVSMRMNNLRSKMAELRNLV